MISRRRLLAAAASATFAAPSVRAASALIPISTGGLSPGFTNMYLGYIARNKLDEKHGLTMAPPAEYTSLYAFHNDFAAGTFDLAIGSWDTFAVRYAGGVPIRLLCSLNSAEAIGIVAAGTGTQTVEDLKGKLVAATQGSGVYRMLRAVLEETTGLEIERACTIQNVDSPALAVTMLLGQRADAAVAWEPNISVGMLKRPDLKVVFNAGHAYRDRFGLDMPFLAAAIREDALKRSSDMAKRVNAMLHDCTERLWKTPGAITPEIATATRIGMDAIAAGIESGRVNFSFLDANETEGRRVFEAAADFLFKHKAFPTPVKSSFFDG